MAAAVAPATTLMMAEQPPVQQKRDFASSFWGEQDLGLDAVIGRLRQGKHVCEQVLTLVKERASIEEDYGKRLTKLAVKSFTTKEEIGSMQESLDILRAELEKSARSHLELASALRTQIEKPMAEFMSGQSAIRKHHSAAVDKLLKLKTSQTASVLKAKERYETKCKEADDLASQLRPNLPTKEADKLRQKLEKTKAASNQADFEYKSSVDKLAETTNRFVEGWRDACVEAQKLEEERLEFLRDNVWNFTNMLSSVCVSDDETCEQVRKSLERLDVEGDITLFIETRSTGTQIPAPVPYVKYSRSMDLLTANSYTFNSDDASISARSSLEKQQRFNTSNGSQPAYFSLIPVSESGDPPRSANDNLGPTTLPTGSRTDSTSNSTAYSKSENRIDSMASLYTVSGVAAADAPEKYDAGARPHSVADGTDPYINYDPYDIAANPTIVGRVKVLYDYRSQANEELSIQKGQIIPVLEMNSDGWWEGLATEDGRQRKGLFPSNFVAST